MTNKNEISITILRIYMVIGVLIGVIFIKFKFPITYWVITNFIYACSYLLVWEGIVGRKTEIKKLNKIPEYLRQYKFKMPQQILFELKRGNPVCFVKSRDYFGYLKLTDSEFLLRAKILGEGYTNRYPIKQNELSSVEKDVRKMFEDKSVEFYRNKLIFGVTENGEFTLN